ncbi:hypothetical protein Dsin_008519 [Dipteronia sinensis]|uniref:Uncharacterized protein n=1 Tax=Dipteronia sinensis TaxID=43782 RepID=A0AAE0APX9_9ROSI|nr:hypothetical protein Dsin_008519 [Dipteronia sinensis]
MILNREEPPRLLRLLPVSFRLLQSLDDQCRRGWDDRDFSLSVLHRELDSHAEDLLVLNGFADLRPKPNRPSALSHIRGSI